MEAKWLHNNGGALFEQTTITDEFPLGKLAD
jgi:hypothetical protein